MSRFGIVILAILVLPVAGNADIPASERQALIEFYNSTNGPSWTTRAGWLGPPGTECSWYGITCDSGQTTVQTLSMDLGQNVSGTLPPSLGNLTNLRGLVVNYCNLSGSIPRELGRLTRLTALMFYNNRLTGSIPSELGNLTNLVTFNVAVNGLSGQIPSSLGNLRGLGEFQIQENQLSGPIPPSLVNLTGVGFRFDIRYNALYSTSGALTTFLNAHQSPGDWSSTQTVAPTGLNTSAPTPNSITVNWTPILFTSFGGFYQVSYSTSAAGPYTAYSTTTSSKSASSLTVTGLSPSTTYYFVVQTTTPPHSTGEGLSSQRNTVKSEFSAETSGTTAVAPPTPPTPPTVTSFSANPPTLTQSGQRATLTWTTSGATSVAISGVAGDQPPNGSVTVSPVATTTYVLTATGPGGTATARATVTVAIKAIRSFAATPPQIRAGEQSLLSWSTAQTTGVVIDNRIGPQAATGSVLVSPLITTTYRMTANGPSGPESAQTTIVVLDSPAPTIASFSATPREVTEGQRATLSWSTVNGVSADIDNGVGSVALSGLTDVRPKRTTVYSLWVNGPGGATTKTATVIVGQRKPPDIGTLAGGGRTPGAEDGAGRSAQFRNPWSIAVDPAGNTFVADSGNNTVRKITPAGVVTTIAGLAGIAGSIDGKGTDARFDFAFFGGGIATDRAGNLYVSDTANNTIRKITPDNTVTTIAGSVGGAPGTDDGQGSGARFNGPSHLAVDVNGVIYVADTSNHTIRKITPAGVVTTLAGAAGLRGLADGLGNAARFNIPHGVAVDSAGNIYVGDTGNEAIRKITPDGNVTTLAGGFTERAGSSASPVAKFNFGCCGGGVAVDADGVVYVADRGSQTVRTVSFEGDVSTLAGSGEKGGDDGPASQATFNNPIAVAIDRSGNLFIADTDNHSIRTSQTQPGRRRVVRR